MKSCNWNKVSLRRAAKNAHTSRLSPNSLHNPKISVTFVSWVFRAPAEMFERSSAPVSLDRRNQKWFRCMLHQTAWTQLHRGHPFHDQSQAAAAATADVSVAAMFWLCGTLIVICTLCSQCVRSQLSTVNHIVVWTQNNRKGYPSTK